jgi:hypothetical protein
VWENTRKLKRRILCCCMSWYWRKTRAGNEVKERNTERRQRLRKGRIEGEKGNKEEEKE